MTVQENHAKVHFLVQTTPTASDRATVEAKQSLEAQVLQYWTNWYKIAV